VSSVALQQLVDQSGMRDHSSIDRTGQVWASSFLSDVPVVYYLILSTKRGMSAIVHQTVNLITLRIVNFHERYDRSWDDHDVVEWKRIV